MRRNFVSTQSVSRYRSGRLRLIGCSGAMNGIDFAFSVSIKKGQKMKTDSEIKRDIKNEFRWESKISNSNVEIDVRGGHVTLTGVVGTYPEKVEAERAAMRVSGVFWVSNQIVVNVKDKRSDDEIRRAIVKAITWNTGIEENHVTVKVKDGWVTLEGEVDFEYQRTKARNLTEDVTGVVGVINLVNVVPVYQKEKIRKAG
jgi:osmotically-inducible protein OsmY